MANFKTCSNGHNFDSSKFTACPYCPGGGIEKPHYEETMKDFKKTQLLNEVNNQQFDRTIINDETMELNTTLSTENSPSQNPFSRTTIVNNAPKTESNQVQTNKRKLVGWLVTFSNDENGQDYKLYVGKNKIGSNQNCEIFINDSSISGEHATILFREGEFLIKDHFSTNGTKINGSIIDEGKLKESDELILGNTIFKFKTVF